MLTQCHKTILVANMLCGYKTEVEVFLFKKWEKEGVYCKSLDIYENVPDSPN